MQTLVVYDIPNDRARGKIATVCQDYGLDRIQYSAFLGNLQRTHQEELLKKIGSKLGQLAGKVHLFTICEKDWRLKLEIVQAGPPEKDMGDGESDEVTRASGQGDKVTRGKKQGTKRMYPWGNEFDKTKCNTSESGIGTTTLVGQYSPKGDSPCGCADMAGNVWEWTSSLHAGYPYKANAAHEDMASSDSRVLRGGAFHGGEAGARAAFRVDLSPGDRDGDGGFRVGVAAPFSPTSAL